MQFVYHSSEWGGLTEIVPRKSTHGMEYVYASKFKTISALFLARWNDFLITLLTDMSKDTLSIKLVERYPNAFEEIFKGQSGYIYGLDNSNFIRSTSWACEVVSSKTERVHNQEFVKDVFELIKDFEERGEIELYYYPHRPSLIPVDDSDMINKAIDLYEMSGNRSNIDYCIERFPELKEQILEMVHSRRSYLKYI